MQRRAGFIAIAGLFLAPGLWAQWLNYKIPGTPRTKDGKPNLAAPAPRGRDGKPDLSGTWVPQPTPIPELLKVISRPDDVAPASGSEPLNKFFFNILADFLPSPGPLQPNAALSKQELALHCLPQGMPMFDTIPTPRKIVQTPGLTMILGEYDMTFRQVFTDGRKLPEDPEPSWLGSSIGHWEGDTLVVETSGTNGLSLLDAMGHTHSDQLRITERYRRVNFGTTELQLTLDDPQTFTRPVTIKFNLNLMPDTDLLESFCTPGEHDAAHEAAR